MNIRARAEEIKQLAIHHLAILLRKETRVTATLVPRSFACPADPCGTG